MSQTLVLKLSDDVYTQIQRQAAGTGTSPDQWLAAALERQYHALRPTSDTISSPERQAARQRFEQHFGEVDVPAAVGADNEQIDQELTRAYADNHEVA